MRIANNLKFILPALTALLCIYDRDLSWTHTECLDLHGASNIKAEDSMEYHDDETPERQSLDDAKDFESSGEENLTPSDNDYLDLDSAPTKPWIPPPDFFSPPYKAPNWI